MENIFDQERIAVIGAGISGLSAAYTLALDGRKVTLFDKEERPGGHALTFAASDDETPVDLGFQVFNLTTYPLLSEFFRHLDVDTETSDMSFSFKEVLDDGKSGIEWASHNLATIFAQRKNLLNPTFLKVLKDAIRFGKEAEEVFNNKTLQTKTLGQFLNENNYSKSFMRIYLLPMTAAVWSVPQAQMLEFPLLALVRFWKNHHLLDPLEKKPIWRVCSKRTKDYVSKCVSSFEKQGGRLVAETVTSIEFDSKSSFFTVNQGSDSFEQVVFACHSDQALKILQNSPTAQSILSEQMKELEHIKYNSNHVVLHKDRTFLPENKSAWASWNVCSTGNNNEEICVTYWLNRLQNFDTPQRDSKKNSKFLRLCTLNPIKPIDPADIIAEFQLQHPVFDQDAISAQKALHEIQKGNKGQKVWFCGAWMKNGFHEDGISSAVDVARSILHLKESDPLPWQDKTCLKIVGTSPHFGHSQKVFAALLFKVLQSGVKTGFLKFVLPNGTERSFGRECKETALTLEEPASTLFINDMSVCLDLLKSSDVGLGEAYMTRKANCTEDSLLALIKILILNSDSLRKCMEGFGLASVLYKVGTTLLSVKHALNKNTVAGSRRNIEAHYDLGNDMYKLFLDDTMTYSSGIHSALDEPTSRGNLLLAQEAKLDNIIKKLEVQEGDWILEIGCGWGSFARRAAETKNCFVVGITISVEQLEYGRNLLKENDLQDRACLLLCDYRKLGTGAACGFPLEFYGNSEFASKVYEKLTTSGSFDKIASIEMIEAVGDEHLNEYFGVINTMLKSGGRACLQAISVKDESYARYIKTSDFIRRHIFPGGCLVSLQRMKEAVDTPGNCLRVDDDLTQDIGSDYATTLRMWRNLFMDKVETIRNQGYPEPFIRKWIFYFIYCEVAFELKYIHDYQVLFVKHPEVKGEKLMAQDSLSVATNGKLPIQSTLLPAILWIVATILGDPSLEMVSFVAVLAVFVTSLLGAMFQDTFLIPPAYGNKSLPSITTPRGAWINLLYSCLVFVSFLVVGTELLDRLVLFVVFGRLAAATARNDDSALPYFLSASVFTCAIVSVPGSPLLYGLNEVDNIWRGLKHLSYLPPSIIAKTPNNMFTDAILTSVFRGLPIVVAIATGKFRFLSIPLMLHQFIRIGGSWKDYRDESENLVNTNELVLDPKFKKNRATIIANMAESAVLSMELS